MFSIPLFRRVPEPPRTLEADETANENPVRAAFVRVWETFQELRGYRQAFLMLVAFLLYNDGIQTIIRMAAIYGAEIGIDQTAQIEAFVVVQFVGIPFSFLFGALAGRIGAKTGIFLALAVYIGISVLGYFMTEAWQFFALAFLVGTVQGGSQALSRSLFARMIPKHKSSEYFGFFSRLREVRRHRRARAVCGVGQHLRLEPRRRPVGHPLLRLRRARPDARQRRGRRSARARGVGRMKVVIAGGTGFLGSGLAASLRRMGTDVLVMSRHAQRARTKFPGRIRRSSMERTPSSTSPANRSTPAAGPTRGRLRFSRAASGDARHS